MDIFHFCHTLIIMLLVQTVANWFVSAPLGMNTLSVCAASHCEFANIDASAEGNRNEIFNEQIGYYLSYKSTLSFTMQAIVTYIRAQPYGL